MAKKKGNTENLHVIQSSEEARELGRKGGIASGKARRKKAMLRKGAQRIIKADIPNSIKKRLEKTYGEIDADEDMVYTAMVAVMCNEALKGNVQAFKALNEMTGFIDEQEEVENAEPDALSRALQEIADKL